jgi:hypothetical protein
VNARKVLRDEDRKHQGCGWLAAACTGDCGRREAIPGTCSSRLCPVCAHTRAQRVAAKWSDAIGKHQKKQHVTLTVGVAEVGQLLPRIRRVIAAFRLLRYSPDWKRHAIGGIYGIHVQPSVRYGQWKGWNVHLHAICIGQGWDKEPGSNHHELSFLWAAALREAGIPTSSPRQVFVRWMKPKDRGLVELCYASNTSKFERLIPFLPPDAVHELTYTMERSGIRLQSAFGTIYGQQTMPESKPCPHCGGDVKILGAIPWTRGDMLGIRTAEGYKLKSPPRAPPKKTG